MKKILSLAIALIMCVAVFASCAGKSAYDIAVENGFDGTVEEWLESLKGADGAQGDKGDKGDKGDTGAAGEAGAQGEKGDKGDAGEKGDQGASGENGQAGAQGEKGDKGDQGDKGETGEKGDTGANGITPLIRVNAETKEWEYSYDNGESWTSTGTKAYVDVYINELGYWVIGGVETEWFAGSQKDENGAEIEIAVEELAVVGATKNADNVYELSTEYWSTQTTAPKLQLTYTLSNERTGVIDVNPGMVIDGEYDLTKGGTYEATIKYLGTAIDVEIEVVSYEVGATECYVQPAGSGEFEIVYTGVDGVPVVVKPSTGKADYTQAGEYTVVFDANADYGWEEALQYTVKVKSMMVYFEDFSDINANMTSDEIFAALGWKQLYQGAAVPEGKNPAISQAGSYYNNALKLTAQGGAVLVENTGTGRQQMQMIPASYMAEAAKYDYSVSFDLTFQANTADAGWITLSPRYRSNSEFKVPNSKNVMSTVGAGMRGYSLAWRMTAAGVGSLESPANMMNETSLYHESGELLRCGYNATISGRANKAANGAWSGNRVFGLTTAYAASNLWMKEQTVTIIIQVVRHDSTYNYTLTEAELGDLSAMTDTQKETFKTKALSETLGWGFHIWMLNEEGQRVLVSRFDAANYAYNGSSATQLEATFNKTLWEHAFGDAVALTVNGAVKATIDNVKVWTGLGYAPADTSVEAYEKLVGTTFMEADPSVVFSEIGDKIKITAD